MKIDPEMVKNFYRERSETNWVKRYQSPYLLRRYFYRTTLRVVAEKVRGASLVLDAGCGGGVFSVLMALWHPNQKIIAMDISEEAVRKAKEAAIAHGVADKLEFIVADAEHLPFKDAVIPALVSCHVLEHLPDFDQGVKEIHRVLLADGIAVIAIPTCLNPSAMALLGGDTYWRISKRTPFAFWIGLIKTAWAWITGKEGVNEGYAGCQDVPHIWRFPWRALQRISSNGLRVEKWMADTLLIPYFGYLIPQFIRLQEWIDNKLRAKRFWRNFGVGVIMVVRKR